MVLYILMSEIIINKLKTLNPHSPFDNWSKDELKELLTLYLVFSKKEQHIFNLIYKYHGCDSWEDIFRDYDTNYLRDKARGVEIAIEQLEERDQEEDMSDNDNINTSSS